MKKFFHDAKATLGLAEKTKDPEYDEIHAAAQTLEEAISSYSLAVRSMEAATRDMGDALAKMSKAFQTLGKTKGGTDQQKAVAHVFLDVSGTLNGHYLPTYKSSISATFLKPLEDDLAKEREKDSSRESKRSEYDTYRESVEKKEAEYAKKGKSLDESKGYKEDVAKRDTAKTAYEKANDDYKSHCRQIFEKQGSIVTDGMKNFINANILLFTNIEKDLQSCLEKFN